ncbi:arylamine N-acetyltransferase [Streptomyces sp. MP131-18]|uniref:arylamine N-acetyltransferase family protein n=1 Tax=Streptomyces sp. MP131-18 TaxID=1857892 RepID=UPI00097BED5E|nr:arylamine N-acetyltransferase [Streptomyces sp. MP131-18]ONK14420.1 Arylamine N-acetyltransferase [Streptomyces sp. MP131-18]
MNDGRIAAYLRRIRAGHPAVADAEALRGLQMRHLHAVPFENLSIHLGEEMALTDAAVHEQVVDRRRGGICYQLNGAFAALLRGLGFAVTPLSGRVVADGGPGLPYDHLVLLVTGAGLTEPWLADVGFGDHAHHPLRYDSRDEQTDPAGTFRLAETADGDLELLRDGKPQLVIEQRPRVLADFEATCWYHRTSPLSHFTRSLVCSRLTEEGRVTLSGRTLKVTTAGGREATELPDEAAVLDAYRTHFGIELDAEPRLSALNAGAAAIRPPHP